MKEKTWLNAEGKIIAEKWEELRRLIYSSGFSDGVRSLARKRG